MLSSSERFVWDGFWQGPSAANRVQSGHLPGPSVGTNDAEVDLTGTNLASCVRSMGGPRRGAAYTYTISKVRAEAAASAAATISAAEVFAAAGFSDETLGLN